MDPNGIREMQIAQAVSTEKIDSLERNTDLIWIAIEKLQNKLNKISNQLSAFGVVNTIILSWIAYRLTRS